VLGIVVAALAVLVVVGGVLVWRAHAEDQRARQQQLVYGDVLRAATAEASAFVNISHETARADLDRVAAGATGDFRRRYTAGSGHLARVLEKQQAVLSGKVEWAGLVSLGPDRATVVATTAGSVSNRATGERPRARHFRLRLELVREHGRWLTSDIRFVG
jgi:Mce-associated membrane protein